MQRSTDWWASLTDEQRAAVLAMPSGQFESWVLDSMSAAGIDLVSAEMNGQIVLLPPAITIDVIERRRVGD